jgi:hypothetical protein
MPELVFIFIRNIKMKLIIENKSLACITVNVHGLKPLTWGVKEKKTFTNTATEYAPCSNAISSYLQGGLLKVVPEEKEIITPIQSVQQEIIPSPKKEETVVDLFSGDEIVAPTQPVKQQIDMKIKKKPTEV